MRRIPKVAGLGAACEAARSSVALAEGVARTRVEKMTSLAPFDAVVAEVDARLGEWVMPSPPALPEPAAIDILHPVSFYFGAPMKEVDSAKIAPGQKVRVSIDSFPYRSVRSRHRKPRIERPRSR